MLNTRNFQTIGVVVLIVAAILVTLSAVRVPAPALIPSTGSNAEGLAIYQASEYSANEANQKGLSIYAQSERVLAYPARDNVEGFAIYHLSERGMPLGVTDGLAIYQQSEWMQPENWAKSSDPLFQYHQSEWFGK